MKINIFWFRRDFRINDNAGLYHALKEGLPVLAIFIFDKEILDSIIDRTDRRVNFIHQQINHLKGLLNKNGSDMYVSYGSVLETFKQLAKNYDIKTVYTNQDYEPYAIQRDSLVEEYLATKSIQFSSYKDQCIFEKDEIVKDDQKPYTVFTPYSKKWKARLYNSSNSLKKFPSEDYQQHFIKEVSFQLPQLEEMGFQTQPFDLPSKVLDQKIIEKYEAERDFPALASTTRLGIHLRFGTISIRKLVKGGLKYEKWLNQLIWREFYMMILYHFPRVVDHNFNTKYDFVQWRNNPEEFEAWKEGRTGYPLVDAGMRQLNQTGYMHNRVRMVAASFLTKHLLIDWKWGEAYFAEKLLDFELASNNGGWQWAASTGTDAQPYFRVFNPERQQERFDKDLKYIKKWVPEVETDEYPQPIVDHKFARLRAIEAFKQTTV